MLLISSLLEKHYLSIPIPSSMKLINPKDTAFRFWHPRPSRREFISTMGVAMAGES